MTRTSKIIFFLLRATVIATTLAYGTVHQPLIAIFYVAVAVIMGLWAADCLMGGGLRFSRELLQVPLILLGAYALVQIIPFGTFAENGGMSEIGRTISVEPFATRLTAIHIFALSIFFSILLVYLDSAARLRRFVSVLIVFGFVYAFFAILQSVLSPNKIYGVYGPAGAVPFGSFVNRHNFAALMVMLMSLPAGLLMTGAVRRDKRLLYVVAIVLMGSAVLLSGSRGGLVALVAELLMLIFLTSRARGRRNVVLKVALASALIFAAIGGAIFVGGDTSLTRFSDAAAANNISSSRTEIWDVTLKVIYNNMPFGAGLGTFAQAYTPFDTASGLERVEQAHNDYLQILADAGLPGVVIGGLFLFWFFRAGKRNTGVENRFRIGVATAAFAGCFAVLVHSLFDFVLHVTAVSVMFLTVLGLLVAAGRDFDDDIDEFDELPSRRRRKKASVTPIRNRSTPIPNLNADRAD